MRASYGALEHLVHVMAQSYFTETASLTMLPDTISSKTLRHRLEHALLNEQTTGLCKVSLKYVNANSSNSVFYGSTLKGGEIVDWVMEKIGDNKRVSAFSIIVAPVSISHENARVYFFMAI